MNGRVRLSPDDAVYWGCYYGGVSLSFGHMPVVAWLISWLTGIPGGNPVLQGDGER